MRVHAVLKIHFFFSPSSFFSISFSSSISCLAVFFHFFSVRPLFFVLCFFFVHFFLLRFFHFFFLFYRLFHFIFLSVRFFFCLTLRLSFPFILFYLIFFNFHLLSRFFFRLEDRHTVDPLAQVRNYVMLSWTYLQHQINKCYIPAEGKTCCIKIYIYCDQLTNINRSDYSHSLKKLYPGTAGNDEASFTTLTCDYSYEKGMNYI